MPSPAKITTVTIVEPRWEPDKLVLFRHNPPDSRLYVWCGRSMGWRPFEGTSKAFFHLFPSMEAAETAAGEYINLPVQEQ